MRPDELDDRRARQRIGIGRSRRDALSAPRL